MTKKEIEIQKYMTTLDLTREQAEQLWNDDHSDMLVEGQLQLEQKAQALPRQYVGGQKKDKVKRERKIDTVKGEIITVLKDSIEKMGAIVLDVKTETEIDFIFGDDQYKIKLTKKRKVKEN